MKINLQVLNLTVIELEEVMKNELHIDVYSNALGAGKFRQKFSLDQYFSKLIIEAREKLNESKDILIPIICDKLKLCERVKNEDQLVDIEFVSGIYDACISYLVDFPIPLTYTIVYLLKKGYFNEICKCD